MKRRPESHEAPKREPEPAPRRAGGARRIVRTLAQSTLLAAGLAATHLTVAEIDPRCPIFSPTLVDRLQSPITRFHE